MILLALKPPNLQDPLELAGIEPGELIGQRYRVERALGRGGMGIVIEAVHVDLGERYAVKVLLPDLSSDKEIVERFLQEARTSAKLKSPHIARVFDFGVRENGSAYLVMEYLEGLTLGDKLGAEGPLDVSEAATILYQVCMGLEDAHGARLVHRDIKPDNIFIEHTRDGKVSVKVLDFGISKKLDESEAMRLTKTGAVFGSPLYMSPEQLRASGAVDERSDLWAVGAVLYEALTGSPPFTALTMTDLVLQISQDTPADPRTLRADIPEGLAELTLACLAKRSSDRPTTASEVAAHLEPFIRHAGQRSSARISQPLRRMRPLDGSTTTISEAPSGSGDHVALAGTLPRVEKGARRAPRRANTLIAVTAGLFLLGGAIGVAARLSSRMPDPAAVPSRPQDETRSPASTTTLSATAGTPSTTVSSMELVATAALTVPEPAVSSAVPRPSSIRIAPKPPAAPPSTPATPLRTAKPPRPCVPGMECIRD